MLVRRSSSSSSVTKLSSLAAVLTLGLSLFLAGCMGSNEKEEEEQAETNEAELGQARRPARPAKVLVVVSAADFIWVQERDTGRIRKTPAGYFLSELGFPLARLLETGSEIDTA
jgi:hypothetical protein